MTRMCSTDGNVLAAMRRELAALGPYEGSSLYALASAPLGIQLHSWGWSRETGPEYASDGQRRQWGEQGIIQIGIQGEGRFSRAGSERLVPPGHALLLTVPDAHRYWAPAGSTWEFIYLTVMGAEALRLLRQIIAVVGEVLDLRGSRVPALTAALIARMGTPPAPSAFAASAHLWQVLMALAEEELSDAQAHGLPEPIARAVAFGRRRWAGNPTVDDLATAAGLSRHHFTRCFTAALGMPPGQWLDRLRMAEAATLLHREPATSIAAIARACGFAEANHFARCFRRVVGMSPSDWRTRREA